MRRERVKLPIPAELRQEIRFCTTPDGTRLAYATVGSGPPLVRAAHWITHLDYDWQSPVWRHWLVGLARQHMLVRYDERGCGLSDHDVADFSLDAWLQDLETVVDDLGLDRFPLLGVSQGGAVAIAYAARHPGAGEPPGAVRRVRPRPPAPRHDRRTATGSGAAGRDGPPRMGPRRSRVPPLLHLELHP